MPRFLQALRAIVERPPAVAEAPPPPPTALEAALSSVGGVFDQAKDFLPEGARAFLSGLDGGRRPELVFVACAACIAVVAVVVVAAGRRQREDASSPVPVKEVRVDKSHIGRASSGGSTVVTAAISEDGSSLGSIDESEEEEKEEESEEEAEEEEEAAEEAAAEEEVAVEERAFVKELRQAQQLFAISEDSVIETTTEPEEEAETEMEEEAEEAAEEAVEEEEVAVEEGAFQKELQLFAKKELQLEEDAEEEIQPRAASETARRMSVPYKKVAAKTPEELAAERAKYDEFLSFIKSPSGTSLADLAPPAKPSIPAASRRATVVAFQGISEE